MKARVKATGEIVEVINYSGFDGPDYWTRLEHQYAGMAMQGFCANPIFMKDHEGDFQVNEDMVAVYAYDIAHALVEKMKEERK